MLGILGFKSNANALDKNSLLVLVRTDRLTMFLPAREHTITWGSACLVEDTEILLADGTFVSLLHSIGQAIWTDQQDTRRIKRIVIVNAGKRCESHDPNHSA